MARTDTNYDRQFTENLPVADYYLQGTSSQIVPFQNKPVYIGNNVQVPIAREPSLEEQRQVGRERFALTTLPILTAETVDDRTFDPSLIQQDMQSGLSNWMDSVISNTSELKRSGDIDEIAKLEHNNYFLSKQLENSTLSEEELQQIQLQINKNLLNIDEYKNKITEREDKINKRQADLRYQIQAQLAQEDEGTGNPFSSSKYGVMEGLAKYFGYEAPEDIAGSLTTLGPMIYAALGPRILRKIALKAITSAGASGPAAAWVGAGATSIGLITAFMAQYRARKIETAMESGSAYENKLNNLVSEFEKTNFRSPTDKELSELKAQAYEGIQQLRDANMNLFFEDVAQAGLLAMPWNTFIRSTFGYSKYGTAAIGLLALALESWGEGKEEGYQHIVQEQYMKNELPDDTSSISYWWDTTTETAKAMFGVGNPEYMNSKEFRNAIRSGMVMGGLFGAGPTVVGTVDAIRKLGKDQRAIKDLVELDIDTQKELYRQNIYAKAYQNSTQGRILNTLEELKGSQYAKDNNISNQDIDNEINLAKKAFTNYKYVNTGKLSTNLNVVEKQGIVDTLIGTTENINRANNSIQEHEDLITDLYSNVNEVVNVKEGNIISLNRTKNRIDAIENKLDSISENKDTQLDEISGYKKYLQIELSKSIKDLEIGLESNNLKESDIILPIDEEVQHFESLNLDNEYDIRKNSVLYSYLSNPNNVIEYVSKLRKQKEIFNEELSKEQAKQAEDQSEEIKVKDREGNQYVFAGKDDDGNYQFLNQNTQKIETFTPEQVEERDLVEESTEKSIGKEPTLLIDKDDNQYLYLGKTKGGYRVQDLYTGNINIYFNEDIKQLGISSPEGIKIKDWVPGSLLNLLDQDNTDYKKFKDKLDENKKEIEDAKEVYKDTKKNKIKEDVFNNPIEDIKKFVENYTNPSLGNLTFAELFGTSPILKSIPVVYNDVIGLIKLRTDNTIVFETIEGISKEIGDLTYSLSISQYNLHVLKNFLFNIEISSNGDSLTIEGIPYKINKINPLTAIEENDNGDPISVTLKHANTNKSVTFTNRTIVEELSTYLLLTEEAKHEVLNYFKTDGEDFVKVKDPGSKYGKEYYVYNKDGEYIIASIEDQKPINSDSPVYTRVMLDYNNVINDLLFAYGDIATTLNETNEETKKNIQDAIRQITEGIQPATEGEILDAKSASELQNAKGTKKEEIEPTNESEELGSNAENDLIEDKSEELAEENTDIIEPVVIEPEVVFDGDPIESTDYENEIIKANRDAELDGLLDVSTAVAWTANDNPVFDDFISDSKLSVEGWSGEIQIDFEYNEFWNKHPGLKEKIQAGKQVDLSPVRPDFFDEIIGENIVDSLPLEIVLIDNEGNQVPGNKLYYHNSGYSNILIPSEIVNESDRVKYVIAHKRNVRANRSEIITELIIGNKVKLDNIERFRGKLNTEHKDVTDRNKNLRKVFKNTKDFTLGIADSGRIIRKRDNSKMVGRGSTGNVFLETKETLDGSTFNLKLNLPKLSKEHAEILFNAVIQKHTKYSGGNSSLYEGGEVSNMSVGEIIDYLALEGTITDQNNAVDPQDHLRSKTLYGKNNKVYYGENETEINTAEYTEEEKGAFIKWATENKNYIINRKQLGRQLNRDIKIGNIIGKKNQLYDNFVVDNNLVLTDLIEGRPFHAPVIGFDIVNQQLDDAAKVEENIPSPTNEDLPKGYDILNDIGSDLAPFRLREWSPKKYKPIDLDKELSWLKKALPDLSVELVNDFLKINEVLAFSFIDNYGITLFRGSEIGTVYHEAFHYTSLALLTGEQRSKIYDEAKKIWNLGDMVDEKVEEVLAEKFREFVLFTEKDTYKPNTSIKAFFSRLWRLLYTFFTGRIPNRDITLNRLFEALNNKEYRYVTKFNDIKGRHARQLQSRDRIKQITGFTTDNIREWVSNLQYLAFTLNDVSKVENIDRINFELVKDKIEELRDQYRDALERVSKEDEQLNELIRLSEVYEAVVDNFVDFQNLVEDHLAALKIHRVDQNPNEGQFERGLGQSGFDKYIKASYESSAKDNMLSSVKMLIMTLPESKDRSKFSNLFKFIEFDSFWNKLMYDLHNLDNIEQMMDKIQRKSKDVFPYTVLYNKLKADETLQTQFVVSVKKARHKFVNLLYTIKNRKPTFTFSDADVQKAETAYINEWGQQFADSNIFDSENNLSKSVVENLIDRYDKLSENVSAEYNSNGKVDNYNKYVDEIVELFNIISVPVDENVINHVVSDRENIQSLDEGLRDFVTDDINYVFSKRGVLYKKASTGKFIKNSNEITNDNLFRYESQLRNLAKQVAYSRPEDLTVTVLGPGGNPYYVYSENSYVTDTIRKINNDDNNEYLNELSSAVYNRNSYILNQLKNDPVIRKDFKVETFSGFIQLGAKDTGRDYLRLSDVEDFLLKMSAINSGRLPMPTLADRKTYQFYTGIKTLDYKFNVNKDNNLVIPLDSEVINTYIGYILDEYNRTELVKKQIEEALEKGNTNDLVENLHYTIASDNQRAKVYEEVDNGLFKIFKDKNGRYVGNGTKFLLFKEFNKVKLNPNNNTQLRSATISFLRDNIRNTIEFASEMGIVETDVSSDGIHTIKSNNLLDENIINSIAKKEFNGNKKHAMSKIFSNYVANFMMSIIETEKIFTSDPANYKDIEDKIKRLGILTSTGENPRVVFPKGHEFYGRTAFTSATLNTQDINSDYYDSMKSKYVELIKDEGYEDNEANRIANAKLSAYKGMDQTDAQVYISPAMYRELSIRFGDWSQDKQNAFDLLESNKFLDPVEEHTALNLIASPLKLVYFGQQIKDELGVAIYDKMSLAPLFRRVVDGTKLQPLLDRMEGVGEYEGSPKIDYIKFDSAVKAGNRARFNYYTNKDRTQVRDLNTLFTQEQNFEDIRRQLVTEPHDVEYTLFGTQVKKVVMGNVRQDGNYSLGTGKEILDIINSSLSKLSNLNRIKLLERIGVDPKTMQFTDKGKFYNMLAEDAKKSGTTDNILNALSTDKNGNPYVNLDAIPNRKEVENRLVSLIDKETVDLELPGNAFIQMTNFGINDDLQFTRIEDNKIKPMECIVSVSLFKNIIPDYDNLTWKEKRKFIQDLNPELLGYRIPTQGKNSTPAMVVVDVLPEQMGDTIMLPKEFTALTGSDFDIDKLYVARYNYNIVDNKAIKVDSNQNTRKGIENKLLDAYFSILLDEKHYVETTTPLDAATKYLYNKKTKTGVVSDIRKLEGKEAKYDWSGFEYSPRYQAGVKAEYTGGKQGIGPFALNNVHHVLGQIAGLKLTFNLGIGHIDSEGNTDLSQIRDVEKTGDEYVYITDWLSALINAHVDIAKDPWIYDLNVNDDTYALVNFLIRAGVGEKTFYFTSQPVLKEYVSESRLQKGQIKKITGKPLTIVRNRWINEMLALDKSNSVNKQSRSTDPVWNKERLRTDINKNTERSIEFYKRQLQILDEFEKLNKAANMLNEVVIASRIDNKGYGKNMVEMKTFVNKFKKVQDNPMIIGFDKLLEDTFLGTLYDNSIVLAKDILAGMTITSTESVLAMHDYILDQLGRKYTADSILINNIADELFSIIVSRFFMNPDNGLAVTQEQYRNMIYGNNTIAKKLRKYKEMESTKDNRIIKMLKAYTDKNDPNKPDRILSFNSQVKEKWDKDDMSSSWEDLLTHNNENVRKFAKDLIIYSFISSGYKRNIYSFFQYIPVSWQKDSGYDAFISDQLDVFNGTENISVLYDYLDDFYKHNWADDDLVPKVTWNNILDSMNDSQNRMVIFKLKKSVANGSNGTVDLYVGDNNGDALYRPYIKVTGEDKIYKYQGYVTDDQGNRQPVYTLINRLGYYEKGVTFKEYGYTESIFNNNKLEMSDTFKNNLSPENISQISSSGKYSSFVPVGAFTIHDTNNEYKDMLNNPNEVATTPVSIQDKIGETAYNLLLQSLQTEEISKLSNEEVSIKLQTEDNIILSPDEVNIIREQLSLQPPEVTQSVQQTEQLGFKGYKGGFENKGKGTPQGDGKDKAMRQIADSFVGEIIKENSSSWTSAIEIGKESGLTPMKLNNTVRVLSGDINTVMLARNSEFRGKPLSSVTKDIIDKQFNKGVEFVVGDMPNVDSQFIDYLQEIGADFTIYHTGNESRIKIGQQIEPSPFLTDQEILQQGDADVIFSTETSKDRLEELKEKYKHCK